MAGAINTELIIGRLKATFRPKSELGSTKSKVRQAQQQTISNKPDQFTPQNQKAPQKKKSWFQNKLDNFFGGKAVPKLEKSNIAPSNTQIEAKPPQRLYQYPLKSQSEPYLPTHPGGLYQHPTSQSVPNLGSKPKLKLATNLAHQPFGTTYHDASAPHVTTPQQYAAAASLIQHAKETRYLNEQAKLAKQAAPKPESNSSFTIHSEPVLANSKNPAKDYDDDSAYFSATNLLPPENMSFKGKGEDNYIPYKSEHKQLSEAESYGLPPQSLGTFRATGPDNHIPKLDSKTIGSEPNFDERVQRELYESTHYKRTYPNGAP